LSEDPLDVSSGDVNLYTYVGNNPVDMNDPLGLQKADTALRVVSDFSAGVGDALTFGLTDWIRNALDINDVVDRCSGAYGIGDLAGTGL
jgi:hypothetical protein